MSDYDPVLWNMDIRLITQWKMRNLAISFCAEGWLANRGRPEEKTCKTANDLGSKKYWEFHQGLHVTWQVIRIKGRYEYTAYYCDAHLPDDLRSLVAAEGGERR